MRLEGKRALVVGLGVSGRAAAHFLASRGAKVCVTDLRPESELGPMVAELRELPVEFRLGSHPEELFLRQDLIIPSPGVPWRLPILEKARSRGIDVLGELEIAAEHLRGPTIGITGTNGKTTTTALVGHLLQTAGLPARTGGNLGTPVLALVDDSTPQRWNVLELSSFQLEATTSFPVHLAAILNVTPDHLDRHGTLEEYAASKARIMQAQTPSDSIVLNADDEFCQSLRRCARGQVYWFSRTRMVSPGAWVEDDGIYFEGRRVADTELPIRGAHNLENALAAVTAASLAGVPAEDLAEGLRTFQPVEHRLEYVRTVAGVDYYNDSKATNVDAAIKAIEAFDHGLWVILGGSDKGLDYCELQPPLRGRARGVLLVGESAGKIERQLEGCVPVVQAGTLARAVAVSRERAVSGDTVLLAPACASFDQFENYMHRGRVFKELVQELD